MTGFMVALSLAATNWTYWDSNVKVISCTLLSDAGGDATTTIDYSNEVPAASGATAILMTGRLVQVDVVPDSGGTQPSDNFTIVINSDTGFDVTQDQFSANIDQADGRSVAYGVPSAIAGDLDVVGSGMGASNGCTVHLYIEQTRGW